VPPGGAGRKGRAIVENLVEVARGAVGLTIDNLLSLWIWSRQKGDGSEPGEHENADLFWGLRGAGANFGIATAFEFRLYRVGRR
jgi:hypothetical protein